ncbi:hypothetical protein ALC56_09556 [Trachymyrmex septentrionalis]|uniref:Uncharacterized protein n=1 Tax=Trachymyrmex septentrionalis TaxID=34720 RepID=A0A151JUA4_9HYME|nr:hypothetical protein ALC56_09556 [Trachymyrmex septentrionalis]
MWISHIHWSETDQSSRLSSLPVLDPIIREILNYSPLPLEERFPPTPSFEDRISLPSFIKERLPPPPPLNPLPPPPFQPDPAPIDWDRLFRLYSSPTNEGDRLMVAYIPGNPTPYTLQYKYLVPMCSCTTFLASNPPPVNCLQ